MLAALLVGQTLLGCSSKPNESEVEEALTEYLIEEFGNCNELAGIPYGRECTGGTLEWANCDSLVGLHVEILAKGDSVEGQWPVRAMVSGRCHFETDIIERLSVPDTLYYATRIDIDDNDPTIYRSDRVLQEGVTDRSQIPAGFRVTDEELMWTREVGKKDTSRTFEGVLHFYLKTNVFDEWYVAREF